MPQSLKRWPTSAWHVSLALVCALMLAPERLSAAQWELIPDVGVGLQFETNPRLARMDEDEATGLFVNLKLPLTYETGRSMASFKPRYRRSFYAEDDDEELEDEDLWLPIAYQYRTQRSTTGFRAEYSDLSVRTSEFEDVDPDNPSDGSGNIRNVDDSQERWSIDPYWNLLINPANRIGLTGGYEDVSYDSSFVTSGRVPYETTYIQGDYTHILDPRNSVSLLLAAGQYDAEVDFTGTENDTTSYSVRGRYTRNISERSEFSITAGINNTEFDITRTPIGNVNGEPICISAAGQIVPCSESDDETNFVGGAEFTRRGIESRTTFSANQAIRPSSNGVTTLNTSFRAFHARNFSARWSGSAGILYNILDDVGNISGRERDYIRGDISGTYKLTPQWSVTGQYRYTWQDETTPFGIDRGDADNHFFAISIQWTGLGWRW